MLRGPHDNEPQAFVAFEIQTVAEFSDNEGGTFCEQVWDLKESAEEAVGYLLTLYGHFSGGGVHAIADHVVLDYSNPYEVAKAHDYLIDLAESLNFDLPIHDEVLVAG